jgi:hypothetical protein
MVMDTLTNYWSDLHDILNLFSCLSLSLQVERIQQAVLDMLHDLFASNDPTTAAAGSLDVHDIRTDCFVKCRQLFLNSGSSFFFLLLTLHSRVSIDGMSARKRKFLESCGYQFH